MRQQMTRSTFINVRMPCAESRKHRLVERKDSIHTLMAWHWLKMKATTKRLRMNQWWRYTVTSCESQVGTQVSVTMATLFFVRSHYVIWHLMNVSVLSRTLPIYIHVCMYTYVLYIDICEYIYFIYTCVYMQMYIQFQFQFYTLKSHFLQIPLVVDRSARSKTCIKALWKFRLKSVQTIFSK